ncbi:MAG: NADH-quinone oxidoreductase subunit NuoI [Desulfobacterota bacterium U4-17]
MEKKGAIKELWKGLQALAWGFSTTFIHLFKKPVTEQYPEQKRSLPHRSRGRIILTRDPDGQERCVACYLCSAVCPVSCISMQSAQRQDGRRYALWFRINFARCIFCGLCEEACPTLAIQLTPDFEMTRRNPMDLLYEKEDLLVEHGGKDKEYNYYRLAGVQVTGPKGSHQGEKPPVDPMSNMP